LIALNLFDYKMPGFAGSFGQMFAFETRALPCGEGAGYAGGIVSAALDGMRVAEAIAAVEVVV
jgi:uncharacterized FAD-dependent dehydrogenase